MTSKRSRVSGQYLRLYFLLLTQPGEWGSQVWMVQCGHRLLTSAPGLPGLSDIRGLEGLSLSPVTGLEGLYLSHVTGLEGLVSRYLKEGLTGLSKSSVSGTSYFLRPMAPELALYVNSLVGDMAG